MAIEQHVRTIHGYETFYQAAGQGCPLVLVHGIGGLSINYASNIEALAGHFHVYAVDIPGHGRSEKPDIDYAIESSVPFIAAFIREVCGEPAALVGMSAGGLMCTLTAAAHPDLVTHLVLVSSAGLGPDVNVALRLMSQPIAWPVVESSRPTPTGIRMAMKRVVHDTSCLSDEMVAMLCEDRLRPGAARVMLRALRSNVGLLGVKRWRNHLRSLRRVGAPVMIIWGKQDRLIPVSHAYRAWRWLGKRARLHIFDGCGHWPPYEHPAEFNRLVLEFVG